MMASHQEEISMDTNLSMLIKLKLLIGLESSILAHTLLTIFYTQISETIKPKSIK